MTQITCPRCGSDKVFNGECSKCGVILSKFTGPEPSPRYAMPNAPIENVMQGADAHHRRMARSRMHTRLIGTGLLLAVFLGGWALYRTISRHAAAYGGPYKNVKHVFGIGFPAEGWSHYSEGDFDKSGIGGIADAFWRGDDPDRPDVLLVVHRGAVDAQVPNPFSGDGVDQLRSATKEHLKKLLEDGGYQCEFTSEDQVGLSGGPGFLFDAALTKQDRQQEALFYCGYHSGGLYCATFIGTAETLSANQQELDKIGRSLNFHIGPL